MEQLIQQIIAFRDGRNWAQFHNIKDLAISLNLEASELLELFQWKTAEEALESNEARLKEELADVLIYALILCHEMNVNPKEIIQKKLEQNGTKYPVDKAYGSSRKYTEL